MLDWMEPPSCEEEDLTDITCNKCDWEGDARCYISGNELTWECPGCAYEHSEDPADRFSQDPDDRY
jgi:hypothetical protein